MKTSAATTGDRPAPSWWGEQTWWHGGPDGLTVGDWIVPALELDALPPTYGAGPDDYPCDPARVYVTSDRRMGMGYASQWTIPGGGSLYRVELADEPIEDPDFAGCAVSYTTSRARIVTVEATSVFLAMGAYVQPWGRYATWSDGTPIYDAGGSLLPSPELLAQGFTADDLATLGRWVELGVAQAVLAEAQHTGRAPTDADVERFAVLLTPGANPTGWHPVV